ncbi:uncharacterized protein Z518_03483 [Rhinocladiella mackenziei CBS 650.93]|uniref:Rhinocladiella mackenziei CBS 650.93 unplaced genomic scaffold supercont1.2, whole genome shotgun sequence n=1 Tax=Rhinocladiella mackenziei CBS 650.93 TaxID=1442369 RepID=A0A0D2IZH0_9EURO|nr:uncharacterized protein Z518_03483 [Rhinocladiella mackenziei CBS 650.93]KIX08826.1 hypothetical protein Z518_03483 [Rhinocladiella mackenziei CBS 650.93]
MRISLEDESGLTSDIEDRYTIRPHADVAESHYSSVAGRVQDECSLSSLTPASRSSPSPALHLNHPPPSGFSPQESGRESPGVYRERRSTYGVVDQATAIPGGSPEARSSEAGGQFLLISEILGEDLPPAHIIEFTLENYINAVHWFMLLFHEPSFRAELQILTATGYVRADRVPFLLLALLVIGIGASYATSSDAQERCPGVDIDALATRLIRKVEGKLLDLYDDAGIETVQVLILLSAYYFYNGRPHRSFALSGSAFKVAQALGIQREPSWNFSDPILREVWRRLGWALYVADVFGAISYGTPCTVQDIEWDLTFPGNIDDTSLTCPGFESMETYNDETIGPVTIFSYQRYKFRLYRIASSIARNVYMRNGATLHHVVGEIKAINERLHQWEKCIPRELRLKHLRCNSTDEKIRQTFKIFQLQALVLQLSYDNIQLVLHRPLLTMNRVPRWPLEGAASAGELVPDTRRGPADDVNGMIRTSKYQCWVSSMRTSRLGEYADILAASRNTHGAAYVGIQSFTAGVVLGIFALSDPLSDQAHRAKHAVSKIVKLPRLHKYRTVVSDQCGAILEELIRLVLAEEMKALLTDGDHPAHNGAGIALQDREVPRNPYTNTDDVHTYQQPLAVTTQVGEQVSGDVEMPESDSAGFLSQQPPDLPEDIACGNFTDALLSLQDGTGSSLACLTHFC